MTDPFVTREELREERPVVMAAFDGDCTLCDDIILSGDDIRSDGQGGWAHALCAEDWDVRP